MINDSALYMLHILYLYHAGFPLHNSWIFLDGIARIMASKITICNICSRLNIQFSLLCHGYFISKLIFCINFYFMFIQNLFPFPTLLILQHQALSYSTLNSEYSSSYQVFFVHPKHFLCRWGELFWVWKFSDKFFKWFITHSEYKDVKFLSLEFCQQKWLNYLDCSKFCNFCHSF